MNAITPNQLEALFYVANGFTDTEAAARLNIDNSSFSERIRGASLKLGATSRPHAIAMAFKQGLLTPAMVVGRGNKL
jgi:DNA-binding CsgD family transcriptional regulator